MGADYSACQLAVLMGVHIDTIRRLARCGQLSGAYRLGGQWRFSREAIERMRGEIRRFTYGPPNGGLGEIEPSQEEEQ